MCTKLPVWAAITKPKGGWLDKTFLFQFQALEV